MTALTREGLWQRLGEAGLVQGDAPPHLPEASPWYVRVMLGMAGWLGALFLLGFVGAGLAFVFRSGAAAIAVGLMCCTGAYAIFRLAPRNDFAAQFGLAVSLAGQVMFVVGLGKGFGAYASGAFVITAAFEAVLAALIANYVHRVWSVFAALLALGYALAAVGIYNLMPGIIAAGLAVAWLNEVKWVRYGSLVRPAGYGLVLALLQVDNTLLFGRSVNWWGGRPVEPLLPAVIPWIGPLLAGTALVFVVHRMLDRRAILPSSRAGAAALAAALAVALVALKAPGIALALIVILLAFAGGNRVLLGLGVIAMLAFLSHFYYSLQQTLLVKSMTLAATGVVLLALWGAMKWVFPDAQGKGHSDA